MWVRGNTSTGGRVIVLSLSLSPFLVEGRVLSLKVLVGGCHTHNKQLAALLFI